MKQLRAKKNTPPLSSLKPSSKTYVGENEERRMSKIRFMRKYKLKSNKYFLLTSKLMNMTKQQRHMPPFAVSRDAKTSSKVDLRSAERHRLQKP